MSILRNRESAGLTLALIFLLGFVTRLVALEYFDVRDRFRYDSQGYLVIDGEHGDDREYDGRAWHLLEGKNFWALPNGDGNAPPGYPFFIAVLYSIGGRHFLVPLVANALLGGVLSLAVYFLARRCLPHRYALLAGAGVAVDPFLIFWSARITTETLAVLLVVLGLIAMAAARENRTVPTALLCGVICGFGILVRGNLIALPVAFAAWNLLTPRLWRQTLVTLAATSLLVISATMIGVAQRPSETTSQWERAPGWLSSNQYHKVALDRAARQKRGSLTDEEKQAVLHRAETYSQSNPWWAVRVKVWIHNFSVFWQLTPSIGSPIVALAYSVTTLVLILFGLVGAASLLGNAAKRQHTMLWLLVIGGFTALHTILVSQPRYRVVLEPLLWILAASGAATLVHVAARRTFKDAA